MLAANIRHIIEAIINPFFISMLVLALAIILLLKLGDSRMVRGCLLVSFMGFLLFSTGWVPGSITSLLENQYEIVTKANPDIHWIVVLGGGHSEEYFGVPANDELSSVSINRLVEGVRLYRQLPKAKLLLSGGPGGVGKTSEAAYLGIVASWFSIPNDDLVLETTSVNTADEAVAIKPFVHHEPFYLVTSATHMPRAMALCQQQGLHPIAAPTDHVFYWQTSRWVNIVLPHHQNLSYAGVSWHEILGLVWGKIRGLL